MWSQLSDFSLWALDLVWRNRCQHWGYAMDVIWFCDKVIGVLWILSLSHCLELVTPFWGHSSLLGNHLLVAMGCGAVTGIVLALEITVKISHIIDLHYWNPRHVFLFQNPWLSNNLVLPFYSVCTLVFKSLGLVRLCNVFVSHAPQGCNYLIRDTVKL